MYIDKNVEPYVINENVNITDALKKLSAHNLSNLTPHPFYVFLNYSHPPVMERISTLNRIGKKE